MIVCRPRARPPAVPSYEAWCDICAAELWISKTMRRLAADGQIRPICAPCSDGILEDIQAEYVLQPSHREELQRAGVLAMIETTPIAEIHDHGRSPLAEDDAATARNVRADGVTVVMPAYDTARNVRADGVTVVMPAYDTARNVRADGVTVVMPAYNEEQNLEHCVLDFLDTLDAAGEPHCVVVVNDGSPDHTAEVADSLASRFPRRVLVVHHEHNQGYGSAVRTGIQTALESTGSSRIFLTDSDGQFSAAELPDFLRYAREERANLVIGYRKTRADSLRRKINSSCWTLGTRVLLRHGSRDVDCAYKLIDRQMIEGLHLTGNAAAISPEIVSKLRRQGARVVEHPVEHHPRLHGEPTGALGSVIIKSLGGLSGLFAETVLAGRLGRLARRALHPRDGVLALVTLAATAASVTAYVHFAADHVTLAYPDAISHLLIARRVVDSSTPGFAQLGAVWLPLPHLLMVPTVWINAWFYSGFSGSIVSMISYVLTTRYLYKTAAAMTAGMSRRLGQRATENRLAGVLAAVLFAANPNVLYMQSTAMTEMLLLACLAATVYHLLRWCQTGSYRQLAATAVATLLGTLTRYEAWPVCLATIFVVAWVGWHRPPSHRKPAYGVARSGRATSVLIKFPGFRTFLHSSVDGNGHTVPTAALLVAAQVGANGHSFSVPEFNGNGGLPAADRLGTTVLGRASMRRPRYKRAQADVAYFAFLALLGIAGWFVWNRVIFHDAFYFQSGQFAKPSLWVATGEKAIGHWSVATMTYLYAMVDDLGWLALAFGLAGFTYYLVRTRLRPDALAPMVLLSLLPFYIGSLYFGQRPLHVMQINGNLYNVRFGLMMVLPVALFAAYLAEAIRAAVPARPTSYRRVRDLLRRSGYAFLLAAVIACSAFVAVSGTDTLKEALAFRSTATQRADAVTASWLGAHYDGGLILMESFGNEAVTFESHVPMNEIVYEGSYREWGPALVDPVNHHIRWIYMRRTPGDQDNVWTHLHRSGWIRDYYVPVYRTPAVIIYEYAGPRWDRTSLLRTPSSVAVGRGVGRTPA
jgi:hypothetical protein